MEGPWVGRPSRLWGPSCLFPGGCGETWPRTPAPSSPGARDPGPSSVLRWWGRLPWRLGPGPSESEGPPFTGGGPVGSGWGCTACAARHTGLWRRTWGTCLESVPAAGRALGGLLLLTYGSSAPESPCCLEGLPPLPGRQRPRPHCPLPVATVAAPCRLRALGLDHPLRQGPRGPGQAGGPARSLRGGDDDGISSSHLLVFSQQSNEQPSL